MSTKIYLLVFISVFCSFFHLSLFISFLLYSMSISNFISLYLHFFSPSSYPFFYILCPFLISSVSAYLSSFFVPFLSFLLFNTSFCFYLYLVSFFVLFLSSIFMPISILIYLYNLRDAQCLSFRHHKRIQKSASIRHCVLLSVCLSLC